jgi:hypothetical protein
MAVACQRGACRDNSLAEPARWIDQSDGSFEREWGWRLRLVIAERAAGEGYTLLELRETLAEDFGGESDALTFHKRKFRKVDAGLVFGGNE